MAFGVNFNPGQVPSTGVSRTGPTAPGAFQPSVQPQPAIAQPQDQVTTSAPVAAPPPAPFFLNNKVKLQHLNHQGQMALYATLPGGPSQLLAAPVLLSVSLQPGQTAVGGQFAQARAYQVGDDGKVLLDADKKPKELPATVMSDGRIYVRTNPDNPNAPMAMLDPDGSYGLATPAQLKVPGDEAGLQGYTREQAEFIKADGLHGFRVNEEVGAFGQGGSSMGIGTALTAMVNPLALLASSGTAGGREVAYSELQQTTQGVEARDLHFKQTPGQAWPEFSLGNQWKKMISLSGGNIDMRPRTVQDDGQRVTLQGGWGTDRLKSLFTGGAGMGLSSWTYGSQQNITFVPLSRQQGGATPLPPPVPQAAAPFAPPPPPL